MNTLVTFLGKARLDPETGYGTADYRFPDGRTEKTAFFGLALARYVEVDTTVILGTRGSQWSMLIEHLATEGDEEELRIRLLDSEHRESVDQALLDDLARLMGRVVGHTVIPRLIPFGADADEQCAILHAIADAVPEGTVSMDLTHGFRHLGTIGFLSASMLERVGNLTVRDLWYGAHDMTRDGVTPVLRLDGLLRVQRWVEALDRFDATGDYGVFAPLLIEDGVAEDKANCLRAAAFFERILNVPDAGRKIRTFLPVLDGHLPGASGLFQHRLTERLRWASLSGIVSQHGKLAHQYLDRRDYVRAAMLGREAWVLQLCGAPAAGYEARNAAVKAFEAGLQMEDDATLRDAHWTLTHLRNALAHGTRPPKRYEGMLKEPDRLSSELRDALTRLLG